MVILFGFETRKLNYNLQFQVPVVKKAASRLPEHVVFEDEQGMIFVFGVLLFWLLQKIFSASGFLMHLLYLVVFLTLTDIYYMKALFYSACAREILCYTGGL